MAEAGTGIELAPLTTLKLGGPAERLVRVTDTDELIRLVRAADAEREPLFFLAGGSNVVISDQGVPGTTILIDTRGIEERGLDDGRVALIVAAGEPWDEIVARTVNSELAGMECLSGVPGSVGATPIQNVGAYGQEVATTIVSVLALDRESGEVVELTAAECGFGYRTSRFKYRDRFLILAVSFALDPSPDSEPIRYAQLARSLDTDTGERVPLAVARETVLDLRRSKSMVIDPDDPDSVSAGSFFTNPILEPEEFERLRLRAAELFEEQETPPSWPEADGGIKTSAAWLIERAGFNRGYGSRRAGISTKHTLALINRGGATTRELLDLARELRDGVRDRFGVTLVSEPTLVGVEL